MIPLPFQPDPDTVDHLLHDLCDPHFSLVQIARQYHTTVPALVLWMDKPDVAEQLDQLRIAGIKRTRLVAAMQLPAAIVTLTRIIQQFNTDEDALARRPGDPNDPHNPAAPMNRLRRREAARRAIALLARLARITDPPPRPTPRAIEVAGRVGFDTVAPVAAARRVESTSRRSPDASHEPTALPHPATNHQSPPTDHPSPITNHPPAPLSSPIPSSASSASSDCPSRPLWTASDLPSDHSLPPDLAALPAETLARAETLLNSLLTADPAQLATALQSAGIEPALTAPDGPPDG